MIFVAVGTQKFPFDRLLKKIDKLIMANIIKEEVYAQIGHSMYKPKRYQYSNFLSKEEFELNINKCDILVTHSGVATIIDGLKHNKPVIVVPRLAKYGEHVDDHQIEIANSFSSQNYVIYADENMNLGYAISKARRHKFNQYISQHDTAINTIKSFIDSI